MHYTTKIETLTNDFDGKTHWFQPRAGIVPGAGKHGMPAVVMTLQKATLQGADVFFGLNQMRSDDLGATWEGPSPETTLDRRRETDGSEVVICDASPKWHAGTRKLLSTGHTARYVGDHLMPDPRPVEIAYTTYDEQSRHWSQWAIVEMPEDPAYFIASVNCGQRVDLDDGTILMPTRFHPRPEDSWKICYQSALGRFSFDGATLRFIGHGNAITVPEPRGLYEGSLTCFDGRYFMTLRNDQCGYVATSSDGITLSAPVRWTFDNGEDLGSYNTQQHWVTYSDALFLVYTRRGLNNDHVVRHRAPIAIAQVDPDRLCVIRETERILIPENNAAMGNFMVTDISPSETWVTVGEAYISLSKELNYTQPRRVLSARIYWEQPNRLFGTT